jgi:hypothetical protein
MMPIFNNNKKQEEEEEEYHKSISRSTHHEWHISFSLFLVLSTDIWFNKNANRDMSQDERRKRQ